MCIANAFALPANACCDNGSHAYFVNEQAYFESGENSLLRYDPMLTTCIICTGSLIRKEGLVINKNEITTCPSNSQKLHSKFVRGTYAYCPNCTDYYIWIKKVSYGVICTAGLHNSETFY